MEALCIKAWLRAKLTKASANSWAWDSEELALFGCFHEVQSIV